MSTPTDQLIALLTQQPNAAEKADGVTEKADRSAERKLTTDQTITQSAGKKKKTTTAISSFTPFNPNIELLTDYRSKFMTFIEAKSIMVTKYQKYFDKKINSYLQAVESLCRLTDTKNTNQ